MDAIVAAGSLLQSRFGDPILDVVTRLLYADRIRRPFFGMVERSLLSYLETRNDDPTANARIKREHQLTASAVLDTVDRLIARKAISPHLLRVIMGLWGRALGVPATADPAVRHFSESYGCEPPWFIAVSPGRACNLHCPGCYSASDGSQARLPWSVLDRVLEEAKTLWGIKLVVVSGGEPLAYRSEGKGLVDLVEKHHDSLFLMFTNGLLLDDAIVHRLERTGNLTPALSVEGMRESTDRARGEGVFDRVTDAMRRLREAGVPIGISATATRENSEELLSNPFVDFFFDELDAFYGFLFQYMPMGRTCDVEMMPTPEQRLKMWRRSWDIVEKRKVFLIDFWNYGTMVHGCVAAGRSKGYVHIDWNGKVMPCVFAPYSVGNIQDVYAQGGNLNDILEAPFFKAMRRWQEEYRYVGDGSQEKGNWLAPCPVRDHHHRFRRWVEDYQPEPQDAATGLCFPSDGVHDSLVRYGSEMRKLSAPIWSEEYLGRLP